MAKFFKPNSLRLFIAPCILFLFLIFCYGFYSKILPVSYQDEFLWVGRSYFFEFFIHGDFKNNIWQSYESYDQPKLAEYSYGLWLYPLYIKEKKYNSDPFDYTQFLIKNGFYDIDEHYMNAYAHYKIASNIIKIDEKDSGFPQEYVAKYGNGSLKPINIIYYAREMDILLLAGAVILAYYVVLHYVGLVPAIVFVFFYGFNTLLIDSGLMAHSEALFLFTFNAAFLFMNLFFTKRKIIYLLVFSVFAALCMSTKLNGSMLLAMFFISNLVLFFVSRKKETKLVLLSILPFLISLFIFVSLNPFTYSNPLKNAQYMFEWRMKEASVCLIKGTYENCLLDWSSRIKRIFENFYFNKRALYFNGNKVFEQFNSLKYYGICLFGLFILGLLYLLRLAFNKHINAIVTVCSFVTVLVLMGYYLILDWDRYYVHLVLFFLLFQLLGLYIVIKYALLFVKKVTRRSRNINRDEG